MRKIDPNSLELEERVVKTNKVQKTHKGGRTMSWNALVVVGDGRGHVGAAIGKARGIPDAIRKGVDAAKKSIIEVELEGSTIPHQVLWHYGASTVLLKPASPGTGIVAGGSVRAILEAAGVRDVLAKSLGSSNPINTAWATIEALQQLRRPEDVANLRGVQMDRLQVRRSWAARTATPEQVTAMAVNVKITLVRSPIGKPAKQRATVESLGLRRLHHSVVKPATPQLLGMVRKVGHLLVVEEASEEA